MRILYFYSTGIFGASMTTYDEDGIAIKDLRIESGVYEYDISYHYNIQHFLTGDGRRTKYVEISIKSYNKILILFLRE